jgi:hypothetical protein
MLKSFLFLVLFALSVFLCSSQSITPVNAGFTLPDSACVNSPITVINNSTGVTNYYWSFCSPTINTFPTATNLGNPGGTLQVPVFSDYAFDGVNYYAFVTNNLPGKLVRLNFGNSLLNQPTTTDLGNLGSVVPDHCEGIQIVRNEGHWYAIIVGGQPIGRIVKIDFGTSLSNNSPVATNWGNIGNLAYPTDLQIIQDGTQWYGFTVNAQSNTLTRFNFTNSFENIPTGVNLGNIGGLQFPTGLHILRKDNYWYAFIANEGVDVNYPPIPSSLSRLDFGSSLLNLPAGTNLGNLNNSFRNARDVTIYQSCNQIFGFVICNSFQNDIVRLDFNNSITSVPSGQSLGNIGNFSFPHSFSRLFRVNNDLYSFILNAKNNSLSRLKLAGCTSGSQPNSVLETPPAFSYNTPGTYNITLSVDEGLPTQSCLVKQITILPKPSATISIVYGGVLPDSSSYSGLSYKYYEGMWEKLPDFGGLTPVHSGSGNNVSLAPRKRDDGFAFLWQGKINIQKAGAYYFETESDDGSKLYIGNYGHYITPVVDNDGQHGQQVKGGWYTFSSPGQYDIAVSYFENGGDQVLKLYWGSTDAGIAMHTPIPDVAFSATPPPIPSSFAALSYKYYEGTWEKLPDFGGLTPLATGTAPNISLAPRKRDDGFAFLWQGKINIAKAGSYYFETQSDDGSKLYIGNYGHYITPVVDNDGQHAGILRGGWYSFPSAGQYDIAVSFFENGGDQQLKVYWGSTEAGIPMHTPIPDAAFASPADCSATLTASSADSYLWSTGETTRSIIVNGPGSYSVTVTTNGCSATASANVYCVESEAMPLARRVTGAVEQALAGSLSLSASPNPSPSFFTIKLSGIRAKEKATLIVSDALGRVMETRSITADGVLQLGDRYRPGLYHIQLIQGHNRKTIKLIKTTY